MGKFDREQRPHQHPQMGISCVFPIYIPHIYSIIFPYIPIIVTIFPDIPHIPILPELDRKSMEIGQFWGDSDQFAGATLW